MNTCMHLAKDGVQYRLVQYGLDFFIEDEETRKGVDSRYTIWGWSTTGQRRLKQWVESLGYTVTKMEPL